MKVITWVSFVLVILIISCTNPTSSTTEVEYAPVISGVKISLADRTKYLFSDTDATAFFTVSFELEEPKRHESISKICITNPFGLKWVFNQTEIIKKWDDEYQYFVFSNLYSSSYKHAIVLGNYKITVSESGKQDTEYQVYLSSYDSKNTSGCIYSNAVNNIPKFVEAPLLSVVKNTLQTSITISGFNVSNDYYGSYVWLFNTNQEYINTYNLADPFPADKIPTFSFTQALTLKEYTDVKYIVVVLYAKNIDNSRYYRYYHMFSL